MCISIWWTIVAPILLEYNYFQNFMLLGCQFSMIEGIWGPFDVAMVGMWHSCWWAVPYFVLHFHFFGAFSLFERELVPVKHGLLVLLLCKRTPFWDFYQQFLSICWIDLSVWLRIIMCFLLCNSIVVGC
jgi:hypothetical protein